MLKRWRLLLFIVAAVMVPLVGLGFYLNMPPNLGVSVESFRLLHKGMTREQVQRTLGRPGDVIPVMLNGDELVEWKNGNHTIQIVFSPADGKYGGVFIASGGNYQCFGVSWIDLSNAPETIPEMVRRWAKDWIGW